MAKTDSLPPAPAEPMEGDEEPMAEDNLPIDTRIVDSENDKGANLRKKPSIASALVDRLTEGTLVNVLVAGEEWCQVKVGRKIGYVMTRFRSRVKPCCSCMAHSELYWDSEQDNALGLFGAPLFC